MAHSGYNVLVSGQLKWRIPPLTLNLLKKLRCLTAAPCLDSSGEFFSFIFFPFVRAVLHMHAWMGRAKIFVRALLLLQKIQIGKCKKISRIKRILYSASFVSNVFRVINIVYHFTRNMINLSVLACWEFNSTARRLIRRWHNLNIMHLIPTGQSKNRSMKQLIVCERTSQEIQCVDLCIKCWNVVWEGRPREKMKVAARQKSEKD